MFRFGARISPNGINEDIVRGIFLLVFNAGSWINLTNLISETRFHIYEIMRSMNLHFLLLSCIHWS